MVRFCWLAIFLKFYDVCYCIKVFIESSISFLDSFLIVLVWIKTEFIELLKTHMLLIYIPLVFYLNKIQNISFIMN